MRNIPISKEFYQELKSNIDTNLICIDIEVLEYIQIGKTEYLKIELPFVTTGSILTYRLNRENNELTLIDTAIYIANTNNPKEPYIDNPTIIKLFNYCRNYQYKNITNDPRVSKIFEIIAKGLPLNDETLKLYAINEYDIQELIDDAILIKTESNQYNISLTRNLYHYGIKLLLNNKKENGRRCLKKCNEYDSDNKDYYFYSLLTYIKKGNYQDVLKILSLSEELEIEENQIDKILYLYLLNMLTDCSKYFSKISKKFNPDDLIETMDKENLEQLEYEIKKNIIINKFKYAFRLISEKIKYSNEHTIKDKVLRELLCHVVNNEEIYKYNLSLSVKQEHYYETISLIETKLKQRYLNSNEKYIYLLTKTLIQITTTRKIPFSSIAYASNVYEAIKGNNFVLAQTLNDEYLQKRKRNSKEDLVNILLTKINNLILEIKLDVSKEIDLPFDCNIEKFNLTKTSNDDILDNQTITPTLEKDNSNEDKSLSFAEELAYYIKAENMTLENGRKKLGISSEQVLLIKLIYARDYFIEGIMSEGDKLLKEVEKCKSKDPKVRELLYEIKRDRLFYKNRTELKTRKRTINIQKF